MDQWRCAGMTTEVQAAVQAVGCSTTSNSSAEAVESDDVQTDTGVLFQSVMSLNLTSVSLHEDLIVFGSM